MPDNYYPGWSGAGGNRLLWIRAGAAAVALILALIPAWSSLAGSPENPGEKREPLLWTKTVHDDFDEIIEIIKSAAAGKNFPVRRILDYKKSFGDRIKQVGGKKLPFDQYKILEFCNVTLAIKSLREDMRMGIFMPCRIVVYKESGSDKIVLMTVNPNFMPEILDNPKLSLFSKELAAVIEEIFESVEN